MAQGLMMRILPLVCGAVLAVGAAQAASTVPFTDTFSYPESSDLNGANGWLVTGDGAATVQSGRARIGNATLSNLFSPVQNAVTLTLDLEPVFTPSGSFPSDSTFRFFVNTNGLVTAYDGGSPTALAHTPLVEGVEASFRVDIDYPLQAWSLWVNGVKVGANLGLSAGSPTSRFEELGFVEGSTNDFSYVDNVSVQAAASGSAAVLPFRERFDTLDDGDLDGQRGWSASDAIVQGSIALSGKAGSITSRTGYATHTFIDGQTNVWTDLHLRPLRGQPPSPPAGSTFAFYVTEEGRVTAYDGRSRTELPGTFVPADTWVRFSTYSDYASTNWDLYLNGRLIGEDLAFYDASVTAFSELGISGAGSNTAAYVDNIYIGTRPAVSGGAVLVIR